MKLLNWILAGAAALSLSACSSEDAPNPGPGSETTTEGIYSSIYFRMPEARSEASEGEEEGKDSENRVGSIVVILADTENKFVTYAMSDNPVSKTVSTPSCSRTRKFSTTRPVTS